MKTMTNKNREQILEDFTTLVEAVPEDKLVRLSDFAEGMLVGAAVAPSRKIVNDEKNDSTV